MTSENVGVAVSLRDETDRLSGIAEHWSSEDGFNARLIDYCFKGMKPFLDGASTCLELGCADGRMTRRLVNLFPSLTAVDGSLKFVEAVRRELPRVEAVHSLFEDLAPRHKFERVIMSHILEHVQDPVGLLRRAKSWLVDGGLVVITVPHAESIHRQVGLIMGLLKSITDLSEADHRIGHRRYYTRATLLRDVQEAGLTAKHVGGVFFKPLSNGQIEEDWSEELMDAFYELGKSYPELCADLLVVAG